MTQKACHKMVAAVAKAAAGELYDTVMGDNEVFSAWKRQNPGATPKQLELRFIAKNWSKCLPFARATLATMLNGPLEEHLKDQIVDALSKDASLRPRPGEYQRFLN